MACEYCGRDLVTHPILCDQCHDQVQRNIRGTLAAIKSAGLSTDGTRFDAFGRILPYPGSAEWYGAGLPPVDDGDDTDAILVASGRYRLPFQVEGKC